MNQDRQEPTISGSLIVCPDGPILVRGDFVIVTPSGKPVSRQRPPVALCKCGARDTALLGRFTQIDQVPRQPSDASYPVNEESCRISRTANTQRPIGFIVNEPKRTVTEMPCRIDRMTAIRGFRSPCGARDHAKVPQQPLRSRERPVALAGEEWFTR